MKVLPYGIPIVNSFYEIDPLNVRCTIERFYLKYEVKMFL